jgi:hypothetical protein
MKTRLLWSELLSVVAIVVFFAVTGLSAAALPAGSATDLSSALTDHPRPFGTLMGKTLQPPASGNKVCPTTSKCIYVADKIGGVQVFSGTSLIASIPVVLTTSDPSTCPQFAYDWFGSILVSDECGNNGLGELRVLNPTTNAWGTPITIAGGAPLAMVGDSSNGKLYVSNFGHGTVTVLSSKTTVAGTVSTCAPYPMFLDYDSASKWVFVGNEGFTSAACVDMINGTTARSPITSAGTHTFGLSDSITGVTVNQHTGNVYVNDADYNSPVGGVFEYSKRGVYKAAITPPAASDDLTGSVYDASTQLVYVVSQAQDYLGVYNATGFVFTISSSNVVSGPIFAGLTPNAGCYDPGNQSIYVPNTGDVTGSGVTVVKGTTVHNISIYGSVEGYGCGAN